MNFGQGEEPSGKVVKHPNHVWLRYTICTENIGASVLSILCNKPPSETVLDSTQVPSR